MSEEIEKSIGFKVMMACPVPGVDVVLGMAVNGIADSIKDSAAELIGEAVAKGAQAAVSQVESAVASQTQPIASGLSEIAKAVDSLAASMNQHIIKS